MAVLGAGPGAAADRGRVLRQGLELALFFGLCLAIDHFFLDGTRFREVQPHPFWIIVLLFTAQYGTGEGLAAATAATAVLLVGNLPPQLLQEDPFDYTFRLSANPMMWLTAAVLLGEIRSRQRRRLDAAQAALAAAGERERLLGEAYDRLSAANQGLEERVAGQLRTVFTLYRAARAIEKLGPGEVLLGIADLVREVLSPSKFSVYLLNGNELEAAINEGWEAGDGYATLLDAASPLFRAVIGGQQILCVARPAEARALAGEGVLAGPLISRDTGEVVGMLKIEDMGFLDLHLAAIENFRILCEWIGTAFSTARRYEDAQQGSLMNPDGTLLSATAMSRQSAFLVALGRRVGFSVTMVTLTVSVPDDLGNEARMRLSRLVNEVVGRHLRNTDLAFDFQRGGYDYAVLLPATAAAGAQKVAETLRVRLTERLAQEALPLAVTASVSALHRAG
ncbi:MAG: hypothetical protein OHK0024_28230 [Thalassobaculales bacterium]